MKNNNILKSFVKEQGSLMFVIKRNDFKYYLSVFLTGFFTIIGILLWAVLLENEPKSIIDNMPNWLGFLLFTIGIPAYLYFEFFKSQKEQFLILSIDALEQFYFWHKKENRKEAKYLNLNEYGIISISLKGDNEIILLTEKELPWGNRKIVISDEFKDRKEQVLEFLKLIYLKG